MKHSLRKLIGYHLETKDGEKGNIKDFLFDEKEWVIRYLEVDMGFILPGTKVLIPRVFLEQPDWVNHIFPIDLSEEEVEKCPPLDDNIEISRKYEQELDKHFKIIDYWSNINIPPVGGMTYYYPPRPINAPVKIIDEKDLNTSIRSFKEVKGYQIQTLDGVIGSIDDLIIDDTDWQVIYAVIDTNKWLPWGKKVLISVHWLDKISYSKQKIYVDLNTETIKNAPEFDYSEFINEAYEKKLYNYYRKPMKQD